MPEPNQQQPKAVSNAPFQQPSGLSGLTSNVKSDAAATQLVADRRDKFYLAIATAIMGRQTGRTPGALARECRDFTDAFLAALDAPVGA